MKTKSTFSTIAFLIILILLSTGIVIAAESYEPSYGVATVDGDPGEWDLANDHFAELYHAGNPDKAALGDVYLRYDCYAEPNPILYVLVLTRPDVEVTRLSSTEEHFVKLGNDTLLVDTNTPLGQFAYVNSDGTAAGGWEAWAELAPNYYPDFNVHTQVLDTAGDEQTAGVPRGGIPLGMTCDPTAVNMTGIQVAATPSTPLLPLALVTFGLLFGTTTAVVVRRRRA